MQKTMSDSVTRHLCRSCLRLAEQAKINLETVVTTQPRNMSLRGALGFAEAVSPYREIASLRQAQDRRRDPEKTSGQASKSPPRNDMPEQLPKVCMRTCGLDTSAEARHLALTQRIPPPTRPTDNRIFGGRVASVCCERIETTAP